MAEQLYERHTVLTNMLMALGIDEETAIEDFCRIEHVISEKSFAAVKEHYLNYKKLPSATIKCPRIGHFCIRKTFLNKQLRAICAQFPML